MAWLGGAGSGMAPLMKCSRVRAVEVDEPARGHGDASRRSARKTRRGRAAATSTGAVPNSGSTVSAIDELGRHMLAEVAIGVRRWPSVKSRTSSRRRPGSGSAGRSNVWRRPGPRTLPPARWRGVAPVGVGGRWWDRGAQDGHPRSACALPSSPITCPETVGGSGREREVGHGGGSLVDRHALDGLDEIAEGRGGHPVGADGEHHGVGAGRIGSGGAAALPSARTSAPAIGPPPAAVTVPCKVPMGPRGEASTAAKASSRPCPKTLLFSGVPPQVGPARVHRALVEEGPGRLDVAEQGGRGRPHQGDRAGEVGVAIEVPLNSS